MDNPSLAKKIDLTEYYDSKIIGGIDLINNPLYKSTGMDGMMIIPKSMELVHERYKNFFLFTDNDFGKHDSFICKGQRLSGNWGVCRKIFVLGFGQWINCDDVLTVSYANGDTEELQFTMPEGLCYEWKSALKKNGLSLDTEYKFLVRGSYELAFLLSRTSGTNTEKFGVYVSECNLSKNDELKEIIFPDNEFINVFAITVI